MDNGKLLNRKILNPSGFTLIELLVAITIITILSVVGFVSFQNIQSRAKDAKMRADVNAIKKAFETKFDPILNNGQGGYKALSDSDFASGKIPTQPNGSPYPCRAVPVDCNTDGSQGYKVSAVLSNGSIYEVFSDQGTMAVLPTEQSSTCSDKFTGPQQCKVWAGQVPTEIETIYINCTDIPNSINQYTVLPIDCSGADAYRNWIVPYYYTEAYFGSRSNLFPVNDQNYTIFQASHNDPAHRVVTVRLHSQ